MVSLVKAITATILLSISISCLAANTHSNKNKPAFYVIGEAGWSKIASGQVPNYRVVGRKQEGGRLSMGYLFPISNQLSIGPEVGYGYYGRVNYVNRTNLIAEYTSQGWDALANLKFAASPKIDVYVKAGIIDISQRLIIKGPNVTPGGFYQQKIKPMTIVGIAYNLTNCVGVTLNYSHIFAAKAPLTAAQDFSFTNVDRIASVNSVMVGIKYLFRG